MQNSTQSSDLSKYKHPHQHVPYLRNVMPTNSKNPSVHLSIQLSIYQTPIQCFLLRLFVCPAQSHAAAAMTPSLLASRC